jgi:hypothetical protein
LADELPPIHDSADTAMTDRGMSQEDCMACIRKGVKRTPLFSLSYRLDFGLALIWFDFDFDFGFGLVDCFAVGFAFGSDPTVRFLREHMEKAGCPVWSKLFAAVNCTDNKTAGGYMSGRGVYFICLYFSSLESYVLPQIRRFWHFCVAYPALPFYSCPLWFIELEN